LYLRDGIIMDKNYIVEKDKTIVIDGIIIESEEEE